jgi:hypothetical protein
LKQGFGVKISTAELTAMPGPVALHRMYYIKGLNYTGLSPTQFPSGHQNLEERNQVKALDGLTW